MPAIMSEDMSEAEPHDMNLAPAVGPASSDSPGVTRDEILMILTPL
jgi:hypothetical protein